jgi:hypothetical protein
LRHNAVQNDLLQLAQHAAIRARDSGLGGLLEEDGRKSDLLHAGMGRRNTNLVLDITIANPCCNSYLPHSSHNEKYTLTLLETNKIEKYTADYRSVGIDFMPLAFEMFGARPPICSLHFSRNSLKRLPK